MRPTPEKMSAFMMQLKKKMNLKSLVVTLAAIVVFTTTYLLILPAFTLDKEEAMEQGGIDVVAVETAADADQAQEDVVSEEPAAEADQAEVAVTEDVVSEEPAAEADQAQEVAAPEEPAAPKEETGKAKPADKPGDAAKPDVKLLTEEKTLKAEQAKGDDFEVSAVVDGKSKVPEDVFLQATELTKDTEGFDYDKYYKDALNALKKDSDDVNGIKTIKFYDISLEAESQDDSVEPEAAVNVKIAYEDGMKVDDKDNVRIVHFAEQKNGEVKAEVLDKKENNVEAIVDNKESKLTEASFDAEGFSVFAIVGAELNTEVTLPGSDGSYEVAVSYGKDAKIPEGATLEVKAIDTDSKKYVETKEQLIAAKKAEDTDFNEGTLRMAALDISILDSNGKPVEPAEGAEVNVSIKMKSLPKGASQEAMYNTMEVQHLNESSGTPVVETVAGVADVKVTDKNVIADFTVDNFSTFALTWTDGSATVHWGKINNGTFEEFDAASLDTAAGSIDLRASYSGYEYIDAVYYTTEPATVNIDASTTVNGRTFINDVITKEMATGSTSSYHWLAEDSHNNAQTFTVADGSHIYAVYAEPDPANPHGPTPPHSDDIPTPTTEKTVSTNTNPDGTPDGTYTIELDITGAQVSETHQTGANVVIIYDISQSMTANVGGMTRLEASRRATHTLINTLKPGTNDIDLALITFAGDANTRTFNGSNWTKNGADITNVVDSITNVNANMATSWHEALENAYNLTPPDDDPTYVIFITDGCPSVNGLYSSGHSHGPQGTSNTSDLCYSAALAYSKMIAGPKGQSYSTRVTSGNHSWTINGTGKGEYLYGIYTGTDTNNMLGQLVTASNGSRVITATNVDDINNAFKDIAQTIVNHMGASGVTTTDGVTELSSISADVHGTAGAFEYYRKGGKNEDGTEKYDHNANGGLGVKWTDAPGAIYNDDGSVTWDLSSVGTAEAEVTYVVRFTVWPSQDAYDILANLNNEVVDYDDLPPEVQNQIYEVNGKYYLKTNTTLNTTYTFKGNTYTDPIEFEQGQMVLDETKMNVRKDFANVINKEHIYDEIEFYLLRDGKYYQNDGTVSDTLDDSKVYKLPVNADNDWTNSIFIAPGVMKDGEVLETGHKYSLDEKILVGNEYEYEFTPQTVRPMEINGSLKYLVLVDEYNPAPSGAETYYIDDAAKTYRNATSSDTENVYFVATGDNDETLVGTNRKTAELDITKSIVDNTGNFTEEQLDAETFTYRVTLTVPEGADTSGITAYEYVPRTGEGRFTIFGYQSDDPETSQAISSDVSTFSGKTFGYWTVTTPGGGNTLDHVFTANPDGSMTATIDITLKRNEIIRFTNLPADTEYTIVEMYNNYRQADPSRNVDATGSDMAANIADQGYTTAIATKSRNPVTDTVRTGSKTGTTVSGKIDYLDVRYYNQFTNTLNDVIDVELTGTKHLDGYEWSGERYYFNLAAANGTPLPIEGPNGRTRFYLTEANGSADKSYSFGRIRFTEEGIYTYTIAEDDAGTTQVVDGKAIEYGSAETIKIEIVENNGKLSVKSVTNTSGNTTWDAEKLVANTTITNTCPTVDVNATKEWQDADGKKTDAPEGAKVTFTLYKGGDATDQTIELDGTADENGETAPWVATFSDLPKYEVVNGEPNEIRYTIGETVPWPSYELITTDPVNSGGKIINRLSTWWVRFKKTSMNENEPLSGAVFTLNNRGTTLTLTSGEDGILKTSGAEVQDEFELVMFTNASDHYTLAETDAPAGYLKLEDDVYVYVNSTGVSANLGGSSTAKYTVTGNGTKADPYLVTITNSEGTELPMTGGIGTTIFYILGSLLVVGCGIMLVSRRRANVKK